MSLPLPASRVQLPRAALRDPVILPYPYPNPPQYPTTLCPVNMTVAKMLLGLTRGDELRLTLLLVFWMAVTYGLLTGHIPTPETFWASATWYSWAILTGGVWYLIGRRHGVTTDDIRDIFTLFRGFTISIIPFAGSGSSDDRRDDDREERRR